MRREMAWLAACGWLLLPGCGSDAAPEAEVVAAQDSSAANSPPVIEEVVLEPSRPRPGETVRARVNAHDPDGDPVTLEYRWRVAGRDVGSADERASLHVESAARDAGIEVTVVARDAHGESQPAIAFARVGNQPPSIVVVEMKPVGKVTAGNDISASPRATDPERSEIEFRYHWTVNGETVPVDGPTLSARNFSRGDTIVLEVVASDGDAESEPVVSPPIPVANAAPRIVSQPGAIGADGIFRYAVKAEDPDGDRSFRYRLEQGPEGMVIGFDDGQLQWEPPADAAGSHPVEIEVEDLFGGRTTQRFALQLAYETEGDASAEAAPSTSAAKSNAEPEDEESDEALDEESPPAAAEESES